MSIGGHSSTPDISFAGCGFIGIYHVGVSACLSAYAPHLLQHRILGSSAGTFHLVQPVSHENITAQAASNSIVLSFSGALAGAALLGEVPLELMAKNVLEVAAQSSQHSLGAFSPRFSLANILMDGLERLLPDDIHIRASGRLFVSMTKISDRSNQLVSSFVSKQDLLEALRASSFVPFMSGWLPPRFRGNLVFDGGYSDNLPVFDDFTITVSPFSGDASICPPDDAQIGSLLNLRIPHGPNNSSNSFSLSKENSMKLINAVVPPGVEGMEKLCSQGFQDAMRFLNSGCHIKCVNCQTEQTEEDCTMCKVIMEEAATKTLPLEIKEVFAEVAAAREKAAC